MWWCDRRALPRTDGRLKPCKAGGRADRSLDGDVWDARTACAVWVLGQVPVWPGAGSECFPGPHHRLLLPHVPGAPLPASLATAQARPGLPAHPARDRPRGFSPGFLLSLRRGGPILILRVLGLIF